MSLPFLQSIGLSQTESDLYELLLRLGEASIATILKDAGLKRPTVYKALYSLEKKGLATKRDYNKKIHFRPEPPTKLLSLAETQYNELDRARSDIQHILPQLTSSYIMAVEQPVVRTYEGVEGIKHIYEDTLKEGQPIYAVLQTAEVNQAVYTWLTNVYVKKRVHQKIAATVIVASGQWSDEYRSQDEKELRTTRMVPSTQFPFEHEVDIYGDKVAFINYKANESLIGIVIHHPQIAKTMKAWFDLAWIGASKTPQS